ncbi:MAG: DEAD/DEAH box helicase [Paludibacter sp.]|jgi:ATP-dependent RNA helicase DeaD|nr:DEAD/DEAH box helicase [Paludibacter sp.]
MTFNQLDLKPELLSAVEALGFESPTPVQEKTIPFVLNHTDDLVALAQTGTGKTAAFGLPLLNMLDGNIQQTQLLVLAPTRELCMQIAKDMSNFARYLSSVKIVAVYGGEDIRRQLKQLDVAPQVIIATPGRLLDLAKRKKINLINLRFLVLDEADEMLNMGFKDDIESILQQTPENRRTLLFSATMPNEIARIARQYMKHYEEITVGERNSGAENVEHIYYVTQAKQRYLALKRVVDINPDIYGIVFCRTRQETKEVADQLMSDGYNADALHGDLSQIQRDAVMNRFRIRNLQLLVATDVAARGLDVSDLTHVINYNLPDDSEIYTHRSGRTGRVNKKGVSVSIIHQREKNRIQQLERMLKKTFVQHQIPNGLEVCKKQLFFLIDKMQKVEINEEQIAPYMQSVEEQLSYLEKGDLLKRFVSLEFNRFLEYYRDAEDLNVTTDRYGKADRGDRGDKAGRRVRLKMNIGKQDDVNPRSFLGIINEVTRDKTISIGAIEITRNYTFFDVFEDQKDRLLQSFSTVNNVVVSEAKGEKSFKKDNSYRGEKSYGNDKSYKSDKPYKSAKPYGNDKPYKSDKAYGKDKSYKSDKPYKGGGGSSDRPYRKDKPFKDDSKPYNQRRKRFDN